MGIRGIKSRIFIQLLALFFLSMLLVDLSVLFLFFDRSISHYATIFVAAGGSPSDLSEIYTDYRQIQKISFVFVAINSFLFALFGTHQLSRSYFKPLQRLAKRAETYQDESFPFFSVRKEDNEFSVLSNSLNKMLHRIEDDKRILKTTIESLEISNGELKKAQNDVIRAEKLATVGRLTSGIAHEIGNPIGIVLGYLDLLKQADLSTQDRNDFIKRSEKEIHRISDIIRQLLDMSRPSTAEVTSVSVHRILKDLMTVFGYQPSAAVISFEKHLHASEDRIVADPGRLRQVFLNLILNAIDAVTFSDENKKRILLKSTNMAGDTGLNLDPLKTYIKTSVVDSGQGIENAHMERIFDPFFTTKEPGKGTGLGLSVAFMIVEKLGGRVCAANDERMGAVFEVILPLV